MLKSLLPYSKNSFKNSLVFYLLPISSIINPSKTLNISIHNLSQKYFSTRPSNNDPDHKSPLWKLFSDLSSQSQHNENSSTLTKDSLELELDQISILEKQNNYPKAQKKLLLLLIKASASPLQFDSFSLASLVKKYAKLFYHQGNDIEALKYYQAALEVYSHNTTANRLKLANSLADTYFEIAQIYEGLEEYTVAQNHFQKALDLALKSFGEQDLNTARYYLGLGVNLSSQGNLEKAVEYVNKALNIQTNLLGETSLELVKTYIELGMIYQAWNKDDEALDVYQKTLYLLAEAPEGQEHDEDLANVYEFIGDIFTNERRWEDAATYFEEAAHVREEMSQQNGEKEPRRTLGNLFEKIAECQIELQHYEKAKGNYIQALEHLREVFGEGSEELLSSYHQVANSAGLCGNYKEALEYYQEGLNGYIEGKRKDEIKEDFEAITLYNMIGEMELKVGEYEKAIQNSEIVLEFYLNNRLYARTEEVYERIGRAYEKLGKNEEAKRVYYKALEEHLEYFGRDHPAVNKFHEVLKELYERDEEIEKIEDLEKLMEKFPVVDSPASDAPFFK